MPTLTETQVNTYTTGTQQNQQITALSDGGWVITWESSGQDGDLYGIYAQAYNADGTAQGGETQVNTYTTSSQDGQQVTALSDGGWVITWRSDGQDGDNYGTYAQTYNADGTVQGGETQVNTYTTFGQYNPQVTALSDGGWVITWQSSGQDGSSNGIYAQAYNADGTTQGGETQVNTYATNNQLDPQITALSDGGWVITWTSFGNDGDSDGIYAQAYNADGTVQGGETQVNTYTTSAQQDPQITALSDGGWVITWTSFGQDGASYGIYAQAYNADGTAQGGETQVNTYTTSTQYDPQITALSDGGWVITWESFGNDGDGYGVYAQAYNPDGTPQGGETLVNTYTTSLQYNQQITALSDGGWVITWESFGQDGDSNGIYAQAYNADGSTTDGSFVASTTLGAQQLYNGSGIVTQSGTVASTDGAAIGAVGGVDIVVNGDVIATNGAAIDMSGRTLALNVGSTGNIQSTSDAGVYVDASGDVDIALLGSIVSNNGAAIEVLGGTLALTVGSTGNILSTSDAGVDVDTSGATSIINSGIISGNESGVLLRSSSGESSVRNDGTISGNAYAIIGSQDDGSGTGRDFIYNTGTLLGDVDLRSGDDMFDGRGGTMSGTVFGGAGNDNLRGSEGEDVLDGGIGADLLFGGKDDDELQGGGDSDILKGNAGDDMLDGGTGNDSLFGGAGNDTLIGGTKSDKLNGGSGNDDLFGGNGADSLRGGRGNDTLTGEGGADTFVFTIFNGFDVVTDFDDGTDLLDFSAYGVTSDGTVKDNAIDTSAGWLVDLGALGGEGYVLVEGITESQIDGADMVLA